MNQLGVSLLIGAGLAGSFRSTVGQAMGGIGQMDQGMRGLQNRVMDLGQAFAGLYGLKRLVGGASDLSAEFKDAAITAGLADDKIIELRANLNRLSMPSETNQSVRELLGGYRELVAAGLDDKLARDERVLRAVGRTSTATRSSMTDLGKTTFTLVDQLGIKPEGLGQALESLAFFGDASSFELKDMARHIPSVGAAFKGLGLQGSEAVLTMGAAFEIAMKTAGNQDEAANNLRNLVLKMTSGETVRAFAKYGVSVKKVMRDAMAKGDNPFEAMLDKIQDVTKGDAFNISVLFPDQQAQMALKALLDNRAEYDKMKAGAAASTGLIDNNYGRRLEEAEQKFKAFGNAVDRVGDSIGRSLLPPLGAVAMILTPVITGIADFADASPTATAAVVGLGAAMVILPPALRLVAFGARGYGAAMKMMGISSFFAAGGIKGIGAAMRANPIGLAVSAIGLLIPLAGLIYDHWKPIKEFFIGIWDGIKPKWEAFLGFALDQLTLISTPLRAVVALGSALGNGVSGKGWSLSGVGEELAKSKDAGGRMLERVGLSSDKMAASAGAAPNGTVQVQVDFANLPQGARVSTATAGAGIAAPEVGMQMAMP